ncbi:HVA22 protein a [Spatholobus suberectus]|nr:HVA22 protein a [Spatholobus suberectus]
MALFWFLKLALKCLDHFAWPLLALGYPLCASVQAIETDSHKETRDLISYWILLSLIYLFEYAFSRLLQWFQLWPYIKLMIIFWLIIPDFGRASIAYNNLIRTCISLNPQAVICRLNNWKKFFFKKDNFLLHAERYVKENGTEALEKLIASKNTTYEPNAEATNAIRAPDNKEMQQNTTYKPDAEATNSFRATDNEEMQQTNEKKLQTEDKAIKDLEVIEKKEIPAGKQDIPVVPMDLAPSQNASPVIVETKGIVGKDTAGGELPQSSTHKEVQKEWTCALCHVTTTSEKTLNIHLHGRKHRATCEALKAKNQPVPQKVKSDQSKEELKQKKPYEPAFTKHSKIRCEVCNVYCPNEIALASHKYGKKHLAKIKNLI